MLKLYTLCNYCNWYCCYGICVHLLYFFVMNYSNTKLRETIERIASVGTGREIGILYVLMKLK